MGVDANVCGLRQLPASASSAAMTNLTIRDFGHIRDVEIAFGDLTVLVGLDSQVASIVGKKEQAKRQLLAHSRVGSSSASWLWIGSSSTQFTRREIAFRILAKHGIAFVGRAPGCKHLPKGS
jgi:hypothetical protein